MLYFLAFVFGTLIGSFLNVCIWRIPAGQSIVYPSSHCPRCGVPIRARDNVPLLSYLILRGRCRACGGAIALRYPVVEAVTGALLVVLVHHFGLSPALGVYGVFVAALIVVTFVDLDHQIIPDVISLPGIAVGLLCAALGWGPAFRDSIIGVLVGGGLLYAVAEGYHAWTRREGMGGGDIKLLAMIGAFLGWQAVLVTLLVGSFAGSIIGATLILVQRSNARAPIPFGPFLACGALYALLYGDALIRWYLHLALPA